MAKITKYQKDDAGAQALMSSAMILIIWLSIAGQFGHWEYYIGVVIVSAMWGLGNYDRNPKAYKTAQAAAITSLLMGIVVSASVSFFVFVFRNPEMFTQYLQSPAP